MPSAVAAFGEIDSQYDQIGNQFSERIQGSAVNMAMGGLVQSQQCSDVCLGATPIGQLSCCRPATNMYRYTCCLQEPVRVPSAIGGGSEELTPGKK